MFRAQPAENAPVIRNPFTTIAIALAALLIASGAAHAHGPKHPGDQIGKASYLGKQFDHRPTASGELYDPNHLTAAHRSLPFGTYVKVTNLENGRSVRVRINDRGPYGKGRIIDVSMRAARQFGFLQQGVARVRVEVEDDRKAARLEP